MTEKWVGIERWHMMEAHRVVIEGNASRNDAGTGSRQSPKIVGRPALLVFVATLLPVALSARADGFMLYETNRHIGPLGPRGDDPTVYYGPWTDKTLACKAEVGASNFAGLEYIPSGWPADHACYCYSNPNNACGYLYELCPIGYGRRGLHTDYVFGRAYTLATPGRDPSNASEYGCPLREFSIPEKNRGGSQCASGER
jgi:hypothetical protein